MRVSLKIVIACWMAPLFSVASLAAASSDLRLVETVKNRDKQAVRALLKQGADVNAPQPDGATALHWAAHLDDLETADLLIGAGAKVNVANNYGVTPLALACENGNAAMVEKLLKTGANPNAALPTGETALMTVTRAGNTEAVNALLTRGADLNATEKTQAQTALMWAVSEKHLEVVRTLIAHKADVHARSKNGFTPLLFAARQGDLDIARVLLSNGSDVNEAASDGSSALVVATVRGHVPVAKFLLDQGADSNADGSGYTALHWAAGTWEVQLTGPFGITPRPDSEWSSLAGLQGEAKLDLIKALLAHGTNVNARVRRKPPNFGNGGFGENLIGATPFFLAAVAADVPLMRFLLANGADPNLTMNNKTTPLMVAAGLGRSNGDSRISDATSLEATKFLVEELHADINAANAAGETALHGTAYRGNDLVAQYLVDKGAELNPVNKNGRTPLDVAAGEFFQATFQIHQSTADLLRKLGGTSTPRTRKDLVTPVQ